MKIRILLALQNLQGVKEVFELTASYGYFELNKYFFLIAIISYFTYNFYQVLVGLRLRFDGFSHTGIY